MTRPSIKLGLSTFLDRDTPMIIPRINDEENLLSEINNPKKNAHTIAERYDHSVFSLSPKKSAIFRVIPLSIYAMIRSSS
jgi:hypothetical protein